MYGWQHLGVPSIRSFHESKAKIRVLSGPNRGGKTTRGAWELVCFATGYHPIRQEKYETPNICWAVMLDRKNYKPVILERLREWLPLGTRYYAADEYFQLPEPWGSKIYLKSAEPGETKFAAEGILAAWFDEGREAMEKPFMETLARIRPGWPLRLFMTMTPEDGMGGWTWKKLYDEKSPHRYKGTEIFYFNLYDCQKENGGHLSKDEIEHFVSTFPAWKREAKVYGRPGTMSSDSFYRKDALDRMAERADVFEPHIISVDAVGTVHLTKHEDGDIFVARPPAPGHSYIMPTDMAGGTGYDYTVASILDVTDRAEVAYFKSNSMDAVRATTERIIPLGRYYKRAKAIPEVNGPHGATHISLLKEHRYGNIFRQLTWQALRRRYREQLGYRTNEFGARDAIYDGWQKALREQSWTISEDAISEARLVAEVEGRPDHPPGRHDDHFFSVGIGLAALLLQPKTGAKIEIPEQPKWAGEDGYAWAQ